MADYWHSRPPGERFVSDQHYWRPDLHIWPLWHHSEAVRNTTLALIGIGVLAGVRWWRWIAADENETGD